MKRSEAIKELAQLLSPEYEENGYVDEYHYQQAKEVLRFLELMGMLPPTTKDKDPYYRYNVSVGADPLSWCKWEPEDK